jgi:NAD(P) transhydrogenase
MASFDFDLLVIGSGPAGQRAAIQSAKLGKKTALVERRAVLGGVCINTGTIPSKTIREAALYLSGYRLRSLYGESYTVKQDITMEDLLLRTDHVIRHEIDVTRHQLLRNRVTVFNATASFTDPRTLRLSLVDGSGDKVVSAANVVIATGTEATRASHIPFDGQSIFVSDDILGLKRLPRTLAVVGAGVIGCEYASIFAVLGVRVTLVDRLPRLLPFVDKEVVESLDYHLRQMRMTIWLGETVTSIERVENGSDVHVRIRLASGKQISAEKALYSIGRTGATAGLNLPAAGLQADERGRVKVNSNYQTEVPHIYAAGDVIGFPSLASTSMEQGRLAACHAFGVETQSAPSLFPYGIYTVPEISYVGRNEEELTQQNVPYEVGKAAYDEIARGQIIGDDIGMLKVLFNRDSHELLGVHIIGESASELVHIGQAVLTYGGKIDYFIHNVFNYPTLAEGYKNAAFDGINRLVD